MARIAGIAGILLLGLALFPANAENLANPINTVCFETSDQVRLCYSERLLDDALTPLLVFIPGWTMPASIWEKQLDYFSGKYSIVAFDPRGQGESSAPDFGYTLERRVQDIKELLDRFPERSIVLVSWSLAVLESLAYVEQYGESRLSGLVLVDNSIGEGPAKRARTGINPFFKELRTLRNETMSKFVDAIFKTDPGATMKDRVLASALKMDVEDSIRLLSYPRPRTYWRKTIHRTSTPILYLVTPKWSEQAKLLTQQRPNARAEIFEHAGHALFWDEADQFNLAVNDFIGSLGHTDMEHTHQTK